MKKNRMAFFKNNLIFKFLKIPGETINKCLFFTYQSSVKMLGELGWMVMLTLLLAVLYDDQGNLPKLAEAIK